MKKKKKRFWHPTHIRTHTHTFFESDLQEDGLLTGNFLDSWWPPSLFTGGVLWVFDSNITKFKHTAQHIMLVLLVTVMEAHHGRKHRHFMISKY